jgi:hypothetical protein
MYSYFLVWIHICFKYYYTKKYEYISALNITTPRSMNTYLLLIFLHQEVLIRICFKFCACIGDSLAYSNGHRFTKCQKVRSSWEHMSLHPPYHHLSRFQRIIKSCPCGPFYAITESLGNILRWWDEGIKRNVHPTGTMFLFTQGYT